MKVYKLNSAYRTTGETEAENPQGCTLCYVHPATLPATVTRASSDVGTEPESFYTLGIV